MIFSFFWGECPDLSGHLSLDPNRRQTRQSNQAATALFALQSGTKIVVVNKKTKQKLKLRKEKKNNKKKTFGDKIKQNQEYLKKKTFFCKFKRTIITPPPKKMSFISVLVS